MREIHEFRIWERYASRLFRDDEGRRLGPFETLAIRKIEISPDDPRFIEIGKMDTQISQETEGSSHFFTSWGLRRRYLKAELRNADIFHLIVTSYFEPAGEECGTIYDESEMCPHCGSGAKQVSDLILDLRKLPKSKDIASTFANEVVVSQRLAEALTKAHVSGIELRPVHHKAQYEDDSFDITKVPTGRELLRLAEEAGAPISRGGGGHFWSWVQQPQQKELYERSQQEHFDMLRRKDQRKPKPEWYQLMITGQPVSFAPLTKFGIDPFDDDDEGYYRCPLSHKLGLNMISEAFVRRETWDGNDVVQTAEMIGIHSGIYRPRSIILISQCMREILLQTNAKGYKLDVAHLV